MINSLLMYALCKFVNYLPNQYKKKKKTIKWCQACINDSILLIEKNQKRPLQRSPMNIVISHFKKKLHLQYFHKWLVIINFNLNLLLKFFFLSITTRNKFVI